MSKEAEAVTRFVEQYTEPHPDSYVMRAFLQGSLAGQMINEQSKGGYLQIDRIEQYKDADGDYEHHFVVALRSGIRIRVSVEVDQ